MRKQRERLCVKALAFERLHGCRHGVGGLGTEQHAARHARDAAGDRKSVV